MILQAMGGTVVGTSPVQEKEHFGCQHIIGQPHDWSSMFLFCVQELGSWLLGPIGGLESKAQISLGGFTGEAALPLVFLVLVPGALWRKRLKREKVSVLHVSCWRNLRSITWYVQARFKRFKAQLETFLCVCGGGNPRFTAKIYRILGKYSILVTEE